MSNKEDETQVLCPACGKGMVSPTLAAKVKTVLGGVCERIPHIITAVMPKLADTDKDE